MIFRRLAEHLREQNWTAIVIEFVLLVVGVFLGIQAANWNEERLERELMRGHLAEIAQDLRTYDAVSVELNQSALLRIAAVDYIQFEAFGSHLPAELVLASNVWKAPQTEPLSEDQLGHLMSAINLVRISVRARSGYESLISSGRLGLLGNRDLARQINAYYGNFDDLLDTQSDVFRAFRTEGSIRQFALGISVFDDRPASELVALARENPGFAAYLRSQREWAILHYNLLQRSDEGTRALLAAIEQELAQS
ncbi:MAG: hypothetical protein KDJ14_06980 [Xanthomonadales bacterium]|nr:hypothetical protein [Xanthomonadales bacterium]